LLVPIFERRIEGISASESRLRSPVWPLLIVVGVTILPVIVLLLSNFFVVFLFFCSLRSHKLLERHSLSRRSTCLIPGLLSFECLPLRPFFEVIHCVAHVLERISASPAFTGVEHVLISILVPKSRALVVGTSLLLLLLLLLSLSGLAEPREVAVGILTSVVLAA
jgi:hypothetical protein